MRQDNDGIVYLTESEVMMMGFYPQYLPAGWKVEPFPSEDDPKKAMQIEELERKKRAEAMEAYLKAHPEVQKTPKKKEIHQMPKERGSRRDYLREYYHAHSTKINNRRKELRAEKIERLKDNTERMREIEHNMQVACVRWFRLQYPEKTLIAIPNGGARSISTGAKLRAEGVKAGAPDLFLFEANANYHGLCIEMKTEKGTQSPAQKDFQEQVEKVGYQYAICRSIEEFMLTVNNYLRTGD